MVTRTLQALRFASVSLVAIGTGFSGMAQDAATAGSSSETMPFNFVGTDAGTVIYTLRANPLNGTTTHTFDADARINGGSGNIAPQETSTTPSGVQTQGVQSTSPAIFGGNGIGGFGGQRSGLANLFASNGQVSYLRASLGRFSKDISQRDSTNTTSLSFTEPHSFVSVRFGRMLSQNLGIEARAGFAQGEETKTFNSVDHALAVTSFGGLFGRYQLDMGNGIRPYFNLGLAGTRANFKISSTGAETQKTEIGLGVGAGVEMRVHDRFVVGLDAFAYPENVRGIGLTFGLDF